MSRSGPPSIRSCPSPLVQRKVSSPSSPKARSSPLSGVMVSFPAKPRIVSRRDVPGRMSSPEVPVIGSACARFEAARTVRDTATPSDIQSLCCMLVPPTSVPRPVTGLVGLGWREERPRHDTPVVPSFRYDRLGCPPSQSRPERVGISGVGLRRAATLRRSPRERETNCPLRPERAGPSCTARPGSGSRPPAGRAYRSGFRGLDRRSPPCWRRSRRRSPPASSAAAGGWPHSGRRPSPPRPAQCSCPAARSGPERPWG